MAFPKGMNPLFLALAAWGFGCDGSPSAIDAEIDAEEGETKDSETSKADSAVGRDAEADASADAGTDAETDAKTDADDADAEDAETDADDADADAEDASADAGTDAETDADAEDASADAGTDADDAAPPCETENPGEICCGESICSASEACFEGSECRPIEAELIAEVLDDVTGIHDDGSDSLTVHLSLTKIPRAGEVEITADASHGKRNNETEDQKVVCKPASGERAVLNAENASDGVDFDCRFETEESDHYIFYDRSLSLSFKTTSENTAFDDLEARIDGLTLFESDLAKLIFTLPESMSTSEDGDSVTISVHLSANPVSSDRHYFDVTLQNDDGSTTPYATIDKNMLTFCESALCDGDRFPCWNEDQTITVTGLDDGPVTNGAAHSYQLVLTLQNGREGNPWHDIGPTVLHLLNIDNDSPNLLTDVSSFTVQESGSEAEVNLHLSSAPSAPMTVTATIAPETECALLSGNELTDQMDLAFTAANYTEPQKIVIKGLDDRVVDGDQACELKLVASSDDAESPSGYDGKTLTIAGTNENINAYQIVGFELNAPTIAEKQSGSMSIRLDAAPSSDVTLNFGMRNAAGNDGIEHLWIMPEQMTFTTSNFRDRQTFTYGATWDQMVDRPPRIPILLTAEASSDDPNYNGKNKSARLLITDVDQAGFSVEAPSRTQLSEATAETPATMAFKLLSIPAASVTVAAGSSDASRIRVSKAATATPAASASFTFTPENWNQAQQIYIYAVDDSAINLNNDATITLTASSGDSNFDGQTATSPVFSVEDDEEAVPVQRTLSISCTGVAACSPGVGTATCNFSLSSGNRPTYGQESVALTCESSDVYMNGSHTLEASNNWSHQWTGIISRRCLSSNEGTVSGSATISCKATAPYFTASGNATLSYLYHPTELDP